MGRKPRQKKITCQGCGVIFSKPLSSDQAFCSKACFKLNREKRTYQEKVCIGCGVGFTPKQTSMQKYCSSRCAAQNAPRSKKERFCKICNRKPESPYAEYCNTCRPKHKNWNEHRFCKVCGNRLKSRQVRFCSLECYNEQFKRREYEFKCEMCGKTEMSRRHDKVSKARRFCSLECKFLWVREESLKRVKTNKDIRKLISKATRFAIFERDGFKCRYCGNSPKVSNDIRLELDHMVPICEGGTNYPGNLVTACNVCNSGKAHFKVKLRVVNPFKKKTIVKDDKQEQIGLFG